MLSQAKLLMYLENPVLYIRLSVIFLWMLQYYVLFLFYMSASHLSAELVQQHVTFFFITLE